MALFDEWATPVHHKGWALLAVVLDRAKRASGYRLFVHAAHRSWEKAVAP